MFQCHRIHVFWLPLSSINDPSINPISLHEPVTIPSVPFKLDNEKPCKPVYYMGLLWAFVSCNMDWSVTGGNPSLDCSMSKIITQQFQLRSEFQSIPSWRSCFALLARRAFDISDRHLTKRLASQAQLMANWEPSCIRYFPRWLRWLCAWQHEPYLGRRP